MVTKKRKKTPGPGKPKGTTNPYSKALRRQGELEKAPQLQFRVSEPERAFIEEAARQENPKIARPVPGFLASAALVRAEFILARRRPLPVQPESQPVPA